jgi:hypothetical protein
MKHLLPAIAASILMGFAFAAPGVAARASGASNSPASAKSEPPGVTAESFVTARPITIAQLSPETPVMQGENQAEENSDNPDDNGNSADADNQNATDANQNGDPDNASDPDQNAQADENSDNADQDNSANTQADNGGAEGQNADNADATP